MTEEEIVSVEQVLRREHPERFSHPEAKEGECLFDMIPAGEFLEFTVHDIKKRFKSARAGKVGHRLQGTLDLSVAPLFINVAEFIEYCDAQGIATR